MIGSEQMGYLSVVAVDAAITPQAKGCLLALVALAEAMEDAELPSKAMIAADVLGCSDTALSRYLDELREAGVLRTRRGGRGLLYTFELTGHGKPDTGRACAGAASSKSEKTLKSEMVSPSQAGTGSVVAEREAPPALLVEKRNLGFDALAEVCNIDVSSPRASMVSAALNGGGGGGAKRGRGRAVEVGIREQYWRECLVKAGMERMSALVGDEPERFEEALAAAIGTRAQLYHYVMEGALLTPTALALYWTDLPGMAQQKRAGTGMDVATRLLHGAAQKRGEEHGG